MLYKPRKSKKSMLADLGIVPCAAVLAERNTLDYTTADGTRRIRLHDTDILTFHPKGGFTISIDGWNTVTTRDRLNKFLPDAWRVYTLRGVAHLNGTPFLDEITVGPRGKVTSDTKPADHEKQKRKIDAYMKVYREKGLPSADESGGDPWVFGNIVDRYVMQDWVDSKYRFRLMFVLAMRHASTPDAGIGMHLHDIDRKGGKLDRFHLGRIRRYIRHCLGIG